ncbi:porin [Aureimonas endophytica]|uniref:Porin n=1 Tax=Aureimonas endophytica TaxID=2027858 RepID=A0A917A382_9HYPH|nr:outer membrane beta-barrel protein [Aureimonas endophytica]GGE24156.1 porin [Aureimonas endophytica]
MKRIALLLAFAAVFATPALAADITYDEPPAPAPVEMAPAANWTGVYVGGQAGGAFGGSKGAAGVDGFPNDTATYRKGSDAGFTGGAHVGYDHQINNFIVGGVADFNYIDKDKKNGVVLENGTVNDASYESKADLKYFGTVRGKAGVAVDRVAVYGTGGLAYGKVNDGVSGNGTFTSANGTTYSATANSDKDQFGYAVGGGVDVLATQNVSLGLEYLYTDLGKAQSQTNFAATSPVAAGDASSFSAKTKTDLDFHTVMAKASYRFN